MGESFQYSINTKTLSLFSYGRKTVVFKIAKCQNMNGINKRSISFLMLLVMTDRKITNIIPMQRLNLSKSLFSSN